MMKAPEMFKLSCEVIFKKLGDGLRYDYTIYFECDPAKNTECKKCNCHINGGDCRMTTESKYAKEKGVFE